jgi:multiple sugar transport system permease protein
MVVGRFEALSRNTLTYGTLAAFSAFCLFPFLWMVDTALKPAVEALSTTPSFLIVHPTLSNFSNVLFHSDFLIYFRNSIIVAIFATLVTLIVSVFCSYALSRWPRLPITRAIAGALLVSQMIPGVLLLVPLYILMQRLGLLSTYLALIIVYCTFMIPLGAFMLKGFFDGIPFELEEAAELDGCSRLGFIFRVLLPLSAPGILATGVFAFVTAWNEFMFGYVLINDDARRTLTPGIMIFKGSHQTDWSSLMAASVLAVVPVALCFVYLQRFLVEGLSSGAVKG